MNRKMLAGVILIGIILTLGGCSKYEPDYTIWREAVISDYMIYDDSIDITVDYAYMYQSYGDYNDGWDYITDEEVDMYIKTEKDYAIGDGGDMTESDNVDTDTGPQVYMALGYGNESYQSSRYYTVTDDGYTFKIEADEIDNFENMCDFIKGAGNKIICLTIVDDRITKITETGYMLYGRE